MQPHIATARLRLTPATDADLDALWTLWKDPQVRLYLWDDIEIDRERARATISDAAAVAEQGLGFWTITLAEPTCALVGCAALLPVGTSAKYYPPFAGAVEPLIALAPAFWGRGYAQEALTALLDYAIGTPAARPAGRRQRRAQRRLRPPAPATGLRGLRGDRRPAIPVAALHARALASRPTYPPAPQPGSIP